MALELLDELLEKRPVSFTVLVLFLLDRSRSMNDPKTDDRRSKWEHLVELVERLTKRLEVSNLAPMFRLGYIWFSDDVYVVRRGDRVYFPVETGEAMDAFQSSLEENRPRGRTAMADALEAATKVVERYIEDNDIPEEKYVTIYLFTDGKETKRTIEDVINAADKIHGELAEKLKALNENNRIGLAAIALGKDADHETLRAIASFLREAQRKVLAERDLLEIVDPPYHEKMFITAPKDDRMTKKWEEAVRRFVERLSETAVTT